MTDKERLQAIERLAAACASDQLVYAKCLPGEVAMRLAALLDAAKAKQ